MKLLLCVGGFFLLLLLVFFLVFAQSQSQVNSPQSKMTWRENSGKKTLKQNIFVLIKKH